MPLCLENNLLYDPYLPLWFDVRHSASSLLTPLQLHLCPGLASGMTCSLLPEGLCICSSLCLGPCFPGWWPHCSLPYSVWSYAQIFSYQRLSLTVPMPAFSVLLSSIIVHCSPYILYNIQYIYILCLSPHWEKLCESKDCVLSLSAESAEPTAVLAPLWVALSY